MRTMNSKTARALLPPVIAGAAVMMAALTLNLLVQLSDVVPHVGDVLFFEASGIPPGDDSTRLLVRRDDQSRCILDLNVLHHSGGSLVLEAQVDAEAGRFRAHWAGPRTSDDAGNCGGSADLTVDRLVLDVLSLSAGGYGVGPRPKVALFPSEMEIGN